MQTYNRPRRASGHLLETFWHSIDISDNLAKATQAIGGVENGVPSAIHAICFALPATIGFGVLAWHFDLASSWDAMSSLRTAVAPSMPPLVAQYSTQLLAVLTYMPTVMEMFGARFARFNVFWMQAVVIALAVFDMFTDLPRVLEFMGQNRHHFDTLGPIFGNLSYWVCFGLWWFMASYGFELLFVICAWSLVAFTLKAVAGRDR